MNFMLSALTREIFLLRLEHKMHVFSPPCNILYVFCSFRGYSVSLRKANLLIVRHN